MDIDENNSVLIVTDDAEQSERLAALLRTAGYQSVECDSLASTWRIVSTRPPYAVVILALPHSVFSLPWDLCRELAKNVPSLLVLVVADDNRRMRAEAFRNQADQCFSLPMCSEEFIAYLDAQKQRPRRAAEMAQVSRDISFQMDLSNRRFYRDLEPIDLTRQECALLELLLRNEGKIVSHEEIQKILWETKESRTSKACLKQYILRLRRKMELNPRRPRHLKTVRGLGYRLQLA